jgi:hypothetical protein
VIDSKDPRPRVRIHGNALWYGRRARFDLAPVQWEADVVGRHLGIPVTPMVCVADAGVEGWVGGTCALGPHRLVPVLLGWPARLEPRAIAELHRQAELTFPPKPPKQWPRARSGAVRVSNGFTVNPWTRYGLDRLYVNDASGEALGYQDRRSGRIVEERSASEPAIRAAIDEYGRT